MDGPTEQWVEQKLTDHGKQLHNLDMRLVRVEVKMNLITFISGVAATGVIITLIGLLTKAFGG